VVRDRLDTPEMQKGTKAEGRVYVAHQAPEGLPLGAAQGGEWGRVIVEAAQAAFPLVKTSSLLRTVRFGILTQVSDFRPADGTVVDPMAKLENMQEEAQRLLERWSPGVIRNAANQPRMMVARPIWQQEEPQGTPQWDDTDNLWWLSSLYAFEAAAVTVTV
jgi:hypothetical protein